MLFRSQGEIRQERQDVSHQYQQEPRLGWRRESRDLPTSSCLERGQAPTSGEVSNHWSKGRYLQDAHQVPFIVEIPSFPTYSEDSELSLDENLLQNEGDVRERDHRSYHRSGELDRHPTILSSCFHLFYHASGKEDQEFCWPSDEDN